MYLANSISRVRARAAAILLHASGAPSRIAVMRVLDIWVSPCGVEGQRLKYGMCAANYPAKRPRMSRPTRFEGVLRIPSPEYQQQARDGDRESRESKTHVVPFKGTNSQLTMPFPTCSTSRSSCVGSATV